MNIRILLTYLLISLLSGCTNTIKVKNEKKGKLEPTVRLELIDVKKFTLDNDTAPKSQYSQLFVDTSGIRYFTFLNVYKNSIDFYDYLTLKLIKEVTFNKTGTDGIRKIFGYYIKSQDSIYLYDKALMQLVLANNKGMVLNRIDLWGNNHDKKWFINHPQFNPRTVIPFINTSTEIILPGLYFTTIPESVISTFKFTARINLKTNKVNYNFLYPSQIYGSNYNWPGWLFTEVFTELHPDGNKLIFSFPISHEVYIAELNSENYKRVYAGSNFAKTICSLNKNPKKTKDKMGSTHFARQDTYTAIKYDKYRNVYYRFLLNAIPEATIRTNWKEKNVTVIVMDKDFKYLGETTIGKGEKEWYWQNSFVSEEGLNIEYIEKDSEDFYILKIFTIRQI